MSDCDSANYHHDYPKVENFQFSSSADVTTIMRERALLPKPDIQVSMPSDRFRLYTDIRHRSND